MEVVVEREGLDDAVVTLDACGVDECFTWEAVRAGIVTALELPSVKKGAADYVVTHEGAPVRLEDPVDAAAVAAGLRVRVRLDDTYVARELFAARTDGPLDAVHTSFSRWVRDKDYEGVTLCLRTGLITMKMYAGRLRDACACGKDLTLCRVLLKGPRPLAVDSGYHLHGVFLSAATSGRHDICRMFLEEGAFDLAHPDSGQGDPLRRACAARAHAAETVALLLAHGADPNAPDSTGATPLLDILQCGADPAFLQLRQSNPAEVVRVLLAHGADASMVDRAQRSALWHAAAWPKGSTVWRDILDATGVDANAVALKQSVLCRAVRAGNVALCRALLERGARVGVAPGATFADDASRDAATPLCVVRTTRALDEGERAELVALLEEHAGEGGS